eukprot:PhF_6_TR21647/c0_g1_i1/m.30825/K09584/PDIA6, TXNDC7; protein disulfide-isomerase A6
MSFLLLGFVLMLCTSDVSFALWKAPFPTNIRQITNFSQYKNMASDPEPHVILYFAEWSYESNQVKADFEEAAASMEGLIPFYFVSSVSPGSKPWFDMVKISAYPTIHYIPSATRIMSDSSLQKVPIEYRGPRTASHIVSWVVHITDTDHITRVVDVASEKEFLHRYNLPNVPRVLLFSKKKRIPFHYAARSLQFRYKGVFGFVPRKAEEIIAKYKIVRFPSLIILGDKPYTGGLSDWKAVKNFMEDRLLPRPENSIYIQDEYERVKEEGPQGVSLRVEYPSSHDDLQKYCFALKGRYCGLLLTDFKQKEVFQSLKSVINQVAKQLSHHTRISIVFSVVDSNANSAWPKFFRCTQSPCVVIYQPMKKIAQPLDNATMISDASTLLKHFGVGMSVSPWKKVNVTLIPSFRST